MSGFFVAGPQCGRLWSSAGTAATGLNGVCGANGVRKAAEASAELRNSRRCQTQMRLAGARPKVIPKNYT